MLLSKGTKSCRQQGDSTVVSMETAWRQHGPLGEGMVSHRDSRCCGHAIKMYIIY